MLKNLWSFLSIFLIFFFSFSGQFFQKQYSEWLFLYYDCQFCPNFFLFRYFYHTTQKTTTPTCKKSFLFFVFFEDCGQNTLCYLHNNQLSLFQFAYDDQRIKSKLCRTAFFPNWVYANFLFRFFFFLKNGIFLLGMFFYSVNFWQSK